MSLVMPDSFEYIENDVMEFTDGSDSTLCDIVTGAIGAFFGITGLVLLFCPFAGAIAGSAVATVAAMGTELGGGIASAALRAKETKELMVKPAEKLPTPGF